MSSGQWEVVGRNKKDKNNQNNKKPVKTDKTRIPVPAPKVEDILPMAQVKSIYSNIGKTNKENKKPLEKESKPKETVKKQQPKKTDKNPENVKQKVPKSIESAINMIDVDDFNSCFEISKQRFPEAPLIWLKDLANYLNSKITVEINDPIFSTKSENYPLNVVPVPLKQIMDKAIEEAGGKTIAQVFYDNTVTAMAIDMSKGLPAIGHKLWIQYLALYSPQVTAAQIDKHNSLRISYQNRQPIGLSILWSLGQGGLKDFHVGIKVFKDFMLPLLEMKNYSRFIVKYLIQLLNRHSQIVLSKENYFFIFDITHTKFNIPNDINQELNNLNKKLKAILFAKTGDKKFSPFFETLLSSKLSSSAPKLFKDEVNDILVTCLNRDPNCYFTWKNIYAKYFHQSHILLKYISDNWNKINKQIDRKQLKLIMEQFSRDNISLSLKHKSEPIITELEHLNKTLLSKMTITKKSTFPWKFLTFLVLLTASSLFFYDLNLSGHWQKTQSVKKLKELGVWKYGEKAWDSAHQGYNWTRQRIEEYAPGYVDATYEYMEPYIELTRDLTIIGYNTIVKVNHAIMQKIPEVRDSFEKWAPGFLEQVQKSIQSFSRIILDYSNKAYTYITTEVFVGELSPENMHKHFMNAVDTTQRVAVDYYNWAYEKVQKVMDSK